VNFITEFVLNVLKRNIALMVCEKRKLSKHKLALRNLVDKQVPLQSKKILIVQSGCFILPLPAALLTTLASLTIAK